MSLFYNASQAPCSFAGFYRARTEKKTLFSDDQLPSETTIGKILNRMNYSLKRVQKKSL